jgi:hypothetical protein
MSDITNFFPAYNPQNYLSVGSQLAQLSVSNITLNAGNNDVTFSTVISNNIPGANLISGAFYLPNGVYDFFATATLNRTDNMGFSVVSILTGSYIARGGQGSNPNSDPHMTYILLIGRANLTGGDAIIMRYWAQTGSVSAAAGILTIRRIS